jgi:hypothetical protein
VKEEGRWAQGCGGGNSLQCRRAGDRRTAQADPRAQSQGLTSLNAGMSFRNLDAVAAWIAQDWHYFEKYGLNVTILNIGR